MNLSGRRAIRIQLDAGTLGRAQLHTLVAARRTGDPSPATVAGNPGVTGL
ncbi:MAG TPA: hypothetical protein VGN24_06805 [Rhodanobacter sp.]|nr:hypothetical protein [Rhodanobacter sp.]